MWKLSTCHSLMLTCCILSPLSSNATKCLASGTTEELKKAHPVLIVGKVEKRVPANKNSSMVELHISVQKYLNGKGTFSEVTATEIAPRHPIVGRREYQLYKEYVFPVTLKGKKKIPRATLQPSGCPDLLVEKADIPEGT